jgi:hypothetical protein
MADFTKTNLRQKFIRVFKDILKLPITGTDDQARKVQRGQSTDGTVLYYLSEWSPGDGRTRYRIESSDGRELTMNLSLQEMRHLLDGIILSRELQATGKVAAPETVTGP